MLSISKTWNFIKKACTEKMIMSRSYFMFKLQLRDKTLELNFCLCDFTGEETLK